MAKKVKYEASLGFGEKDERWLTYLFYTLSDRTKIGTVRFTFSEVGEVVGLNVGDVWDTPIDPDLMDAASRLMRNFVFRSSTQAWIEHGVEAVWFIEV